MALTNEQILALVGSGRQKGQYNDRLDEFLALDEGGIEVGTQWPEWSGKTHTTVSQGFKNALKTSKNPGAEFVKVYSNKDDNKVYLVNLKAAGLSLPTEDTEEAAA